MLYIPIVIKYSLRNGYDREKSLFKKWHVKQMHNKKKIMI